MRRQDGTTADMVLRIPQLLAHATSWTALQPGDIVVTGTPDGVGPMAGGHTATCELGGVATLRRAVVDEAVA